MACGTASDLRRMMVCSPVNVPNPVKRSEYSLRMSLFWILSTYCNKLRALIAGTPNRLLERSFTLWTEHFCFGVRLTSASPTICRGLRYGPQRFLVAFVIVRGFRSDFQADSEIAVTSAPVSILKGKG